MIIVITLPRKPQCARYCPF
uniref:Uncharacterized protein n=1 Tax=Lepeophtheirus salmonis TaxID=72036 RepID=A0A0K2UQE9_LEPSM